MAATLDALVLEKTELGIGDICDGFASARDLSVFCNSM